MLKKTKILRVKRFMLLVIALAALFLVSFTTQTPATAMSGPEFAAQINTGINWAIVGDWLLDFLLETVTFLFFGILALWLMPRPFFRAVQRVRTNPFKSFGFGILVVIVGYLAAFLLFSLIIALWLGLLGIRLNGIAGFVFGIGLSSWALAVALFSFFVAFISKLVVAYLVGASILRRYPANKLGRQIVVLLLGLVIYLLLRSVPWVGLVAGAFATLLGLGALWIALREHRVSIKATHPSDEEAVQSPAQQVSGDDTAVHIGTEQDQSVYPDAILENEVTEAD
jgi:hypothetical protein